MEGKIKYVYRLGQCAVFKHDNFSNTCGTGLNGTRNMSTAIIIRIEYSILSTIAHMYVSRELQGKITNYVSGK